MRLEHWIFATDFDCNLQCSWKVVSENASSVSEFTYQLIKGSLTDTPKDDFEVRISTLTAGLDGVRQLTEGGVFNKVVGYFKSLTYVTIWV